MVVQQLLAPVRASNQVQAWYMFVYTLVTPFAELAKSWLLQEH
jgi:hypothetical protein